MKRRILGLFLSVTLVLVAGLADVGEIAGDGSCSIPEGGPKFYTYVVGTEQICSEDPCEGSPGGCCCSPDTYPK